jgi:hypothetical protein
MDSADWGAFLRWPSRGRGWSAWAWLLLLPKLALAAVAWVVVIAAILVVVFAPAAAVALLGDTLGLPGLVTVIAAGAAFVVTLYFAGDLLDL